MNLLKTFVTSSSSPKSAPRTSKHDKNIIDSNWNAMFWAYGQTGTVCKWTLTILSTGALPQQHSTGVSAASNTRTQQREPCSPLRKGSAVKATLDPRRHGSALLHRDSGSLDSTARPETVLTARKDPNPQRNGARFAGNECPLHVQPPPHTQSRTHPAARELIPHEPATQDKSKQATTATANICKISTNAGLPRWPQTTA